MKKQWMIVGALIVLFFGLWFMASRQKTSAPQSQQERAFITPPVIRQSLMPQPLSTGPITYSGMPAAIFPESVPYYTITRVRNFETERDRLFALYNITSAPNTIVGSKGRYASFLQGTKSGTLSESPLTFTYRSVVTSNKFVTNNAEQHVAATISMLADLSVLPPPFTATMSAQRFFAFTDPHPRELGSAQGAVITQLDFVAMVGSIPLYINDADSPAFSASFNGDNALTELRAIILPDITKDDKNLSIISYKEALERLKNNAGIFSSVSLTRTGEKEFMTGAPPSTITVQNVSLGFFYAPNQEFLVPVFVFTGVAAEPNEKAVLRTTTVVSAL